MIRRLAIGVLALSATACLGASPGAPAPIEQRRGAMRVEGETLKPPPTSDGQSQLAGGGGAARASSMQEAAEEAGSVGPLDDWGRPLEIEVEAGDTLFALSEAFQVALRPLIDLNNLEPPFTLRTGQILKLPPPNLYVVAPGDTLYGVARRHRVHFRSLALMNAIKEPFVVSPGDVIVLPALARDWEAGFDASAQSIEVALRSPTLDVASQGPSATSAAARFIWPLEGRIVSGFGVSGPGRRNDGINIAAEPGAPVSAAADGVVVYAGEELAGYGKLVLIKHDGGWISAYAHNAAVEARVDQKVSKGERIARAGSTGSVDAPQLHFELRRHGKPVDPLSELPPRSG